MHVLQGVVFLCTKQTNSDSLFSLKCKCKDDLSCTPLTILLRLCPEEQNRNIFNNVLHVLLITIMAPVEQEILDCVMRNPLNFLYKKCASYL